MYFPAGGRTLAGKRRGRPSPPAALTLYAVHVLFPIGADRLFIDKIPELIDTGFIVAHFGQELRQHLHDKLFLLALLKIQYGGFQFIVSHGCSPSTFLICRIAEY
jgi:hypothetical protein